jgi:hypothetical protein
MDHVIGMALALFISQLVAPKAKIGLIISVIVFVIAQCVNLATENSFTMYPDMGVPDETIDWVKNGILMALTAGVIWFMFLITEDD